jgi:hypothetical protein
LNDSANMVAVKRYKRDTQELIAIVVYRYFCLPDHRGPARAEGGREMSDKICKRCGGSVPADHVGQICPLCGQQTAFDYRITLNPGHLEITGQKATLKHIAEWWVWNWPYLLICALATLGSLISGFFPGWGAVINVACTIIALATGFKAGVKYHREIIQ